MNDVIIWQCEYRKKSGKSFRIPSETTLQLSIFDRKAKYIFLKTWIGVHILFWIPWMSEDVYVRASVNDFTLSAVINVNWEGDGQFSVRNGASVVLKFSLFDRNVQNRHKNSECNYVIGLFNLKTNNAGVYNRFGYLNETWYVHDVTDVRWVSDGGYLR